MQFHPKLRLHNHQLEKMILKMTNWHFGIRTSGGPNSMGCVCGCWRTSHWHCSQGRIVYIIILPLHEFDVFMLRGSISSPLQFQGLLSQTTCFLQWLYKGLLWLQSRCCCGCSHVVGTWELGPPEVLTPWAHVVTPMAAGAQAGRPSRLDMPILTSAG